MVDVNNYPKAYAEVSKILQYLPKEDYDKIEAKFINMIENKKDKTYIYELDDTKEIENQNILKETRAILAYIFLHYLGTQEENEKIKLKFKQDIINAEKQKQEMYSTDIFNKKEYIYENKNTDLVIYKKENIFEKIIKRIRNIFKKKE